MGLEEVKQEIIVQAELEASKIVKEAQEQSGVILEKAQEQVKEYQGEAKVHLEELQGAMERKMLAAARFDAQRKVLHSKKESIQRVSDLVREEILGMKSTEKKKFLASLLKKANAEIDVDTVYVNKGDLKLLPGKVKVKTMDISGGLVAENKDGSISINLSVEQILETAREKVLVELSGVLFRNG